MIGQSDEDTGQAICAFVTLEGDDGEGSDELVDEIRDHVADRIGKFARPKRIIWADDLPKTRSGKIMRRLLRDIAEGRALGDVTTLRDPDVMSQLEGKIQEEQKAEESEGVSALPGSERRRSRWSGGRGRESPERVLTPSPRAAPVRSPRHPRAARARRPPLSLAG